MRSATGQDADCGPWPYTYDDGDLVGTLTDIHAVVTSWPDGRLSVQMPLTGTSIRDAAGGAPAVVEEAAGCPAVSIEVTTEAEFCARAGFELPGSQRLRQAQPVKPRRWP